MNSSFCGVLDSYSAVLDTLNCILGLLFRDCISFISHHPFKLVVNPGYSLLRLTFHGSVIFINEQSCLVTVMEAFMRMLLMDYMEGVVSKLGELSEDISSRVDLKPLLQLLLSVSQDICIQLTPNFSSSIAASDTSPTNTESLSTSFRHFVISVSLYFSYPRQSEVNYF